MWFLLNLLNFWIFSPLPISPRKLSIDVDVCSGAKKWTYDSVRFFQWAGSWKGRRALSRLLLSLSQCHWQPSRNVRPRPTLFVTGSHHSKTHVNLLRKNIRTAAFLVCKCCGVVLIDRNWLWSLFNVRTFSPRVLLDANNVLDLQLQETCFGKSIIWLPHIFLWPCLSWDEAV